MAADVTGKKMHAWLSQLHVLSFWGHRVFSVCVMSHGHIGSSRCPLQLREVCHSCAQIIASQSRTRQDDEFSSRSAATAAPEPVLHAAEAARMLQEAQLPPPLEMLQEALAPPLAPQLLVASLHMLQERCNIIALPCIAARQCPCRPTALTILQDSACSG